MIGLSWRSILAIIVLSLLVSSCRKTVDKTNFRLDRVRSSIFKVRVVSQEPRYDQPWLKKSPTRASGTGFYIGERSILTNAHVVAHGKFITVQRDGDDTPVVARVAFIAHDSDLALLKIDEAKYFKGVKPLRLGGLPVLQKPVLTVGYPLGGEQLSITEGIVSRLSFRRYAHSGYRKHLLIQVDSAINSGNSGGPVFQGDRVVGVAFQAYMDAENTGYIIPIAVVNRFLRDIKDGQYDGHPVAGIVVDEGAMQHELTRQYHAVPNGEGGVKVNYVASFSPLRDVLRVGDILLKIGDYDIGVDGKIRYKGERIDFLVVYDLAQIGDEITIDVVRDQKRIVQKLRVQKPLVTYDPSNRYQHAAKYYIFGGLVFTELSRDYLKTWGSRWYYDAPIGLRYLHHYYPVESELEDSEDIIVLADRLPHIQNRQAVDFLESVLVQVNGQSIRSMAELVMLVEQSEDEYLVFDFLHQDQPLVLNRRKIQSQHQQILSNYKVEHDRWLDGRRDGSEIR